MDLKLIYINDMGYDYKGNSVYQFLFTDSSKKNIEEVWGEGWESENACWDAQPPYTEWVDCVLTLSVHDYELNTISQSEHFGVIDAKCGVIALGYETVDDDYPYDERLVFQYGMPIDDIKLLLDRRKFNFDVEIV